MIYNNMNTQKQKPKIIKQAPPGGPKTRQRKQANYPRVEIAQFDVGQSVERVLLEVRVLEVRVHVEARGAEVVGPRHVRDDALAATADLSETHPHVPVPHLKRVGMWVFSSSMGGYLLVYFLCLCLSNDLFYHLEMVISLYARLSIISTSLSKHRHLYI